MSSEARLYTFSQETTGRLRNFRLGTSRSSEPQAVIYYVDKKTQEIKQDEDEAVYKSLDAIVDELTDTTPRFILLSYPYTLSGRLSVPYVLIYYMPVGCTNNEMRMLYAGAKELMRNTSEVTRVIDIETTEDLTAEELEKKLRVI